VIIRISADSLFQKLSPATEKAWSPQSLYLVLGTSSKRI